MEGDNFLIELAMASLFFDTFKLIFNLTLFKLRFIFRFIQIGKFTTSLIETRSSVFLQEEM